jgi:hypothetical protein
MDTPGLQSAGLGAYSTGPGALSARTRRLQHVLTQPSPKRMWAFRFAHALRSSSSMPPRRPWHRPHSIAPPASQTAPTGVAALRRAPSQPGGCGCRHPPRAQARLQNRQSRPHSRTEEPAAETLHQRPCGRAGWTRAGLHCGSASAATGGQDHGLREIDPSCAFLSCSSRCEATKEKALFNARSPPLSPRSGERGRG